MRSAPEESCNAVESKSAEATATATPKRVPTNEYGNVDLHGGALPEGRVHIGGKRLTVTCRRLGIAHAPAFVGFDEYLCGRFAPILDGVVVFAEDAPKLREAIHALERKRLQKELKAYAAHQAHLAEIRAQYPTWRDAIADAAKSMHGLNRLAYGNRDRGPAIYAAKNRLVEILYREGLCERAEIHVQEHAGKPCWGCYGTGTRDGEPVPAEGGDCPSCSRCQGTGWHLAPRTVRLFCFYFLIGGRSYAWHQPADLVTWPVGATSEPRAMPKLPETRPHGLATAEAIEDAMEIVRVVLEGAAAEAVGRAVGA